MWADERTEIRWFLAVCTARSALLALCTRGGDVLEGKRGLLAAKEGG